MLLLPSVWPSAPETDDQPVGAIRALSAAQEAVGDLAGICERKPDVCETGRKAVHTITVRAKESARVALELLDDGKSATALGEPPAPPTAPIPARQITARVPPRRRTFVRRAQFAYISARDDEH